jgi:hypothetical protein
MPETDKQLPEASDLCDQLEIKIVLFPGAPGFFLADVYVQPSLEIFRKPKYRAHCGRGWRSQSEALAEALEFIKTIDVSAVKSPDWRKS